MEELTPGQRRENITIERLIEIFANKQVKITHEEDPEMSDLKNHPFDDKIGTCKTFEKAADGGVQIVLTDGKVQGFTPDKVTRTSVEGDLKT